MFTKSLKCQMKETAVNEDENKSNVVVVVVVDWLID